MSKTLTGEKLLSKRICLEIIDWVTFSTRNKKCLNKYLEEEKKNTYAERR